MSELQSLIKATREAAKARPDYIYDLATVKDPDTGATLKQGSCRYVNSGCPSCIVGHAAWNTDLIDADFEHSADNESDVEGLLNNLGIDIDYDSPEWYEVAWLRTVQELQDLAMPWGEAVTRADKRYPQCAES